MKNNNFNVKFSKIQDTLLNADFQEYNIITLAMGYFVDKHDMKKLYMYTHINKNHRLRKLYHRPESIKSLRLKKHYAFV